ncbi:MAG: tetratricopeptide repeat protein [Lysobacter sp.]
MQLRSLLSVAVLAAVLAVATSASAQTASAPLAPTSEFYFDEDSRTSRAVVAVEGSGDPLVQQLLQVIQRDPRARAETAQLAHVAMAGGRPDLGRELYGRVLAQLDTNHGLYRSVRWNYGWDLYRAGDHGAALDQWRSLVSSRNVNASWMPTTFALVLWQLGRNDEAVQWYAAAVRTEPTKWRGADQYEALLPDWRAEDRAILAEVQQAWAADPPEWG